ncbi:MAG: adenine deaminase [Actinomycetota bacterium]
MLPGPTHEPGTRRARTEELSRRLAVARGEEAADLVLTGGRVFSVFTNEFLEVDVAISGGHVAGLGRYEGTETVDVEGGILVPGFIDGHLHVESTKLVPDQFARAVLPHGTTTAVIDPHEIANVLGLAGVRELLRRIDDVPIDVFVMVSSCVPASRFESSGATVTPEEIAAFLREEPRALGVAEMMDFPGVARGDPVALAKIEAAYDAGDRHIDGHAPGLSGPALNAYVAAGPASDHECTTQEEALEKRRLGMWIMLREGSAARNLEALLPLVRDHGPRNCLLCTDDREPNDLRDEGHMDAVLRRAVALGCPAEDALVMATLHAARYHRLHRYGAIAPGSLADIVLLDDLQRFAPARVWKRGLLVAEDGRALEIGSPPPMPDWMRGTVHVPELTTEDFAVPAADRVRVIGVRPGQIVTDALEDDALVRGGRSVADPDRDLAKLAVVERHAKTGRIGVGFARGFGIRRGALASTHAHDAHNIVALGVDDEDMAVAVRRLAEIGGGQVAVAHGDVLAELPCPIGGLLTELVFEEVADRFDLLESSARELGVTLRAPFMAMSFLALSVIGDLKLTDHGLLDTVRFELVPVVL